MLVPVDFSRVTKSVVRHAAELAQALGHKLWLLHVTVPNPEFVGFEVGPVLVRETVAEHFREEHRDLQTLMKELEASGHDVDALLVQGPTADRIIEHAEKLKADLIVIGSHGRGALYTALLGSTSHDVLRRAQCPVLVVPIRPG